MAKIPGILQLDQQLRGPAQQPRADSDTLVPGAREVTSSYRGAGEAQQSVYQAQETAAQAQQRADLASGKIGEAIGELADPIEKRYKQMEYSDAQLQATSARAAETEHMITALRNMTAAQLKDPNFVGSFLQDFDDRNGEVADGYNTPEARAHMLNALAETRAQLGSHMLTAIGDKVGALTVQELTTANIKRTQIAAAMPSFAMGQIKDMESVNANTVAMHNMSPVHLEQLNREGGEAIVKAMLNGMAQSNPDYVAKQMTLGPDQRDDVFKGLVGKYLSGDLTERARAEALVEQNRRETLQRVARAENEKKQTEAANQTTIGFMKEIFTPGADHTGIGQKLLSYDFTSNSKFDARELQNLFTLNERWSQLRSEPKPDHAFVAGIVDKIISGDPTAPQSLRDMSSADRLRAGIQGINQIEQFLDGSKTESGRAANALFQGLIKDGDKLVDKVSDGVYNTDRRDQYLSTMYQALEEGHANHLSTKTMVTRTLPDGKPNPNFIGGIIDNYQESLPARTKRLIGLQIGHPSQNPGATEMPAPRIPAFMINSQKMQEAVNSAGTTTNELQRQAAIALDQKAATPEAQAALDSVTGATHGIIEGAFGPQAPGLGETQQQFTARRLAWERKQEKTKPVVEAEAKKKADRRKEDLR